MKYIYLFLHLSIFTILFSQNERSTIYYNGNPVGIDSGNLIYKSDTQGYDELIATLLDIEFWEKVKCGIFCII